MKDVCCGGEMCGPGCLVMRGMCFVRMVMMLAGCENDNVLRGLLRRFWNAGS